MGPERLPVGGVVGEGEALFAVPGGEQPGGGGLGALVVLPLQHKYVLLLEAAGQLFHGLGLPVHAGAELGHGDGWSLPEAHAVGVALRAQLEPEHRLGAALLVGAGQAQPQMVLVGAAAEEPPGVPVDAGHLADEVQVGMAVGKGHVHLVGQRLHGPLKVLSTGGAGRIFWTRTTNPFLSTGDGMAAAFRAGNALKDMEMIQFHPTGLGRTGILMSEAVRGEGGYLLNAEGERFMKKYAPNKMELASRDVVAKAIEDEIAAGRGFGSGLNAYVVADLRHLGPEVIIEKLHGIRDLAMCFEHCDPLTQPVPIRPTCHYTMGGIDVVDYKTCACELPGLFSSGEASCISIHGANRLGGNSLADGVVFGKVSGAGAADYAETHEQPNVDAELAAAAKRWEEKFTEVTTREGGRPVVEIRDALADAMWNKVGIFRNEEGITEALKEIDQLIEDYKTCYVGDPERTYNMAFVNYCEIGSMLTVAKAIAMGALHRRESRGAHIREDHPKRNDERYLKHSLIKLGADGQYELTERDVVFTKYEPQERKY